MKMKRLFTLVLSLMMILSLSAPASAIDGENVYTKEEISSINEVNVAKYAKSFVETIDSTADVTAGNVLTMYSENENIEYSARDCAPQPLKLSIHSGGIEHPCRCR